MAAAIPVVLAAVKVVGTVMSVVTMVKGIKDGNLLQAVAGGFGAFMGVSSLMSGAAAGSASAAAGAADAGAAAAGTAATAATPAASFMSPAVDAFAAPTAQLGSGLSTASTGMTGSSILSGQSPGLLTGSTVDAALSAGAGTVEKSIGDRLIEAGSQVGGFMKDNPELVKVGAGLLGGYTQGKAAEENMAYDKRLEDERRARRGYSVAPTNNPFAVGV